MNWKSRIEGWDKLAEDDKAKYFEGPFCRCGCGKRCKIGKDYIHGHYWNTKKRNLGRPRKLQEKLEELRILV